MSFVEGLLRLFCGPVELFYEAVCTLFLRLSFSSGAAILALSMIVCFLTTPLRPQRLCEWLKEPRRAIPRLLLQVVCFGASLRWIGSVQIFHGASFGPLRDLSLPSGLILFWGGYSVFAVIRKMIGIGYRPMELNVKQRRTDRNNRILLVFCCIYLALLTGLLIPSKIIAASPQEFADVHDYADPVRYLVRSLLTAIGTFVLWGLVYGLLLSPKARKKYTLIISILSGWATVDYAFFGKKYGIVSSELRYEVFAAESIGPVLLNIAILVAVTGVILLLRKKASIILRIVVLYGCIALIVMSVININTIRNGVSVVETSANRQTEEKATIQLTRNGKNVMVIMLDRAISAFVPYFMNERPELLQQFDGFTWYPNTLSYGYHTNIAAPALFGGYEYTPEGLKSRNDKTLQEKHNEALKIMPVNFLKAGYEVTVCDAPYANYQWIPDMSIYDDYPAIRTYNTIGAYNDYKEEALAELERVRNRNLFFYSLFRCTPTVLQETIYDQGMYLETDAGMNSVEGIEYIGVSADFMNSYMVMKNLPTMTQVSDGNNNTFLMITNEMTHNVIELQEPEYEPRRNPNNKDYDKIHAIRRTTDGKELNLAEATELVRIHYHSDMAAFILLGKWFDELRAQGVWDNTRIILVSDHGCYLGLFGSNLMEKYPELADSDLYEPAQWTDTMCYNPLLMVKEFGAKGFTTDKMFMTNADTPTRAFNDLIADPENPYTGNLLTEKGKETAVQRLVESDWAISRNNGIFFTDPLWITFRGTDVFDPANWSIEEPLKP